MDEKKIIELLKAALKEHEAERGSALTSSNELTDETHKKHHRLVAWVEPIAVDAQGVVRKGFLFGVLLLPVLGFVAIGAVAIFVRTYFPF